MSRYLCTVFATLLEICSHYLCGFEKKSSRSILQPCQPIDFHCIVLYDSSRLPSYTQIYRQKDIDTHRQIVRFLLTCEQNKHSSCQELSESLITNLHSVQNPKLLLHRNFLYRDKKCGMYCPSPTSSAKWA